jgi:hypothetical protein
MNENDLMNRLIASKAIMEKADKIKGTPSMGGIPQTQIQEFDMPNVKYNIPQEYLQEQPKMPNMQQPYLSSLPVENTKPVGVPTVEAIKNSKLPDEIKKLMMEHPISQPQQQSPTLSNELVERASRLMKESQGNYVPESAKSKQQPSNPSGNIDYILLQKMINEAVNNALRENGLLVESSEKTGETFSFKVGKHVFEGKVTKIKKLS